MDRVRMLNQLQFLFGASSLIFTFTFTPPSNLSYKCFLVYTIRVTSLLAVEDFALYWIYRLGNKFELLFSLNHPPDVHNFLLHPLHFPKHALTYSLAWLATATALSSHSPISYLEAVTFVAIRILETPNNKESKINNLICTYIIPLHRSPTSLISIWLVALFHGFTPKLNLNGIMQLSLFVMLLFRTILDSQKLPNNSQLLYLVGVLWTLRYLSLI